MKKAMLLLLAAFVSVAPAQELNIPALDDFGGGDDPAMDAPLKMRIPTLEFVDTPLEDALEYLRVKSIELDDREIDPLKKGINIILKTPPGWNASGISLDDGKAFSFSEGASSPSINLKLTNVPIGEALRYVAELSGLQIRVESNAVVLAPPGEDVASLMASLDVAMKRLANGGDGGGGRAMPPTLFEILQSETRVLEATGARLNGQGSAVGDPRRKALEAKLAVTRAKSAEARALLEEFLAKEKALAEEWVAEIEAIE